MYPKNGKCRCCQGIYPVILLTQPLGNDEASRYVMSTHFIGGGQESDSTCGGSLLTTPEFIIED